VSEIEDRLKAMKKSTEQTVGSVGESESIRLELQAQIAASNKELNAETAQIQEFREQKEHLKRRKQLLSEQLSAVGPELSQMLARIEHQRDEIGRLNDEMASAGAKERRIQNEIPPADSEL
jgi:uncharacterized coiled-coil DUF342 family protein